MIESIRVLRMTHFAILLGALLFGVVVMVLRREGVLQFDTDQTQFVSWIAVVLATFVTPTAFVLRSSLAARVAAAPDENAALQQYRVAHIVFVALLESAVLFNIVACLLGGWVVNWGVAGAVWAFMATSWPSSEQFVALRSAA